MVLISDVVVLGGPTRLALQRQVSSRFKMVAVYVEIKKVYIALRVNEL